MSRESPPSDVTEPAAPPRSARVVLLLGVLSGLSTLVLTPVVNPEQVMLASDVYYYAADALLSGGDIYEASPPDLPGYHYLYPPVVVLGFLPHVLLGSPAAAYALQTVLNALFAVAIAVVLRRALARRGVLLSRVDDLLLVGFAFLSSYSAITVVNGQVTIWLAFAVTLGLDALDRDRETVAGLAFAGAALVKVFPAALGLWLCRNRASRGVVVAAMVGLAGLLAGLLALEPAVTETYFTEVLTGRYDGFEGLTDPTETRGGAQRQVAALLGIGPPSVTLLTATLLAPVLGYLYRDIDGESRRQAAALGTILAALLFFPLQRLYMVLFVFPLVVLLYRLPAGRPRTLLLAGTLVSFFRVDFETAEAVLTALSLPGALAPTLVTVAERCFQVILPPTLGMWLLLAACVLVHRADSP